MVILFSINLPEEKTYKLKLGENTVLLSEKVFYSATISDFYNKAS